MRRRFFEKLAGWFMRLALRESPGITGAEIRVHATEPSRIETLLTVKRRSSHNSQLVLALPVGSPMRISRLACDQSKSVIITQSHRGYSIDLRSAHSASLQMTCQWNWSVNRALLFPWHFPTARQWPSTPEPLTTAAVDVGISNACIAGIAVSAADWRHRLVEAAVVSGVGTPDDDRTAPDLGCVMLEPWDVRGLGRGVSRDLFETARTFLESKLRTRPYGRVILGSFQAPIAPGFGGSVLIDLAAAPFREVEHDWLSAAEMVRRLSSLWWGSCTRIIGKRGAEIPFAINAAMAGAWVRQEAGANAAVSWYDNLLPRLGFARTASPSGSMPSWLHDASRLATEIDSWLATKRDAVGVLSRLSERLWGMAVHETWLVKHLKQEQVSMR